MPFEDVLLGGNEKKYSAIGINAITKPFVALPTDRRTKYLQNRCTFIRRICTKKIRAISQLWAEKITFPPKPDIQSYIHTDRRTDICFYRVALLLKK